MSARMALRQGRQDSASRTQQIRCWDIKFVFCQVSVGRGAICCYEIICLIGPRLIRLTVVSAAEMWAVVNLPQMDVGGQCRPQS